MSMLSPELTHKIRFGTVVNETIAGALNNDPSLLLLDEAARPRASIRQRHTR